MAAFDLGFDGLRTAGTFKLDTTTANKIKADPMQVVGKVVTIVGNGEVGYGADTNVPLGVVADIELDKSGSAQHLVTVEWAKTFENIPCTSGDAAGDYLLCDGKGGLKKTTAKASNCKALVVNETVAAIKID